jgi:hypothetical protein
MNVWDRAKELHTKAGLDYLSELNYYMHEPGTYIYKGPDTLAFVESWGDTWCIGFLIGSPAIVLSAMPHWRPYVVWRRALKRNHGIRKIDTARMCRLFGVDPEPLKLRMI